MYLVVIIKQLIHCTKSEQNKTVAGRSLTQKGKEKRPMLRNPNPGRNASECLKFVQLSVSDLRFLRFYQSLDFEKNFVCWALFRLFFRLQLCPPQPSHQGLRAITIYRVNGPGIGQTVSSFLYFFSPAHFHAMGPTVAFFSDFLSKN